MLITEKVKYRNRYIAVKDLKSNSNKKVIVACPECGDLRQTFYKSYLKSKTDKCLKCTNKQFIKKLNKRYGLLTVLKQHENIVLCKCDCGNIVNIPKYNLTKAKTKSCGCIKENNFINAKARKKEQHWNWKGGITKRNNTIRNSVEYLIFRKGVFERDNYTCQKCKVVSIDLNAHHIIPFAVNENEIFNIDNGITLCKKCHNLFHKIYGRKCNRNDLKLFLL